MLSNTATLPAKSAIIYNGPSLLDGAPIVVIALVKSGNVKTGNMVQTYIIRSDIDPRAANKTGADYSICGNCPLKGTPHNDSDKTLAKNRGCYVTIFQGPLNVYKKFKRNGYPTADLSYTKYIGAGRMVRLGTYGDPSAVPSYVWDSLLIDSKGSTGYTHQSGINCADFRPDQVMVSADNIANAKNAWSNGYRTFRVITSLSDINDNEILCPASKEAGHRSTCNNCGLCSGTSSNCIKSIAIVAHGAGMKHVGQSIAA